MDNPMRRNVAKKSTTPRDPRFTSRWKSKQKISMNTDISPNNETQKCKPCKGESSLFRSQFVEPVPTNINDPSKQISLKNIKRRLSSSSGSEILCSKKKKVPAIESDNNEDTTNIYIKTSPSTSLLKQKESSPESIKNINDHIYAINPEKISRVCRTRVMRKLKQSTDTKDNEPFISDTSKALEDLSYDEIYDYLDSDNIDFINVSSDTIEETNKLPNKRIRKSKKYSDFIPNSEIDNILLHNDYNPTSEYSNDENNKRIKSKKSKKISKTENLSHYLETDYLGEEYLSESESTDIQLNKNFGKNIKYQLKQDDSNPHLKIIDNEIDMDEISFEEENKFKKHKTKYYLQVEDEVDNRKTKKKKASDSPANISNESIENPKKKKKKKSDISVEDSNDIVEYSKKKKNNLITNPAATGNEIKSENKEYQETLNRFSEIVTCQTIEEPPEVYSANTVKKTILNKELKQLKTDSLEFKDEVITNIDSIDFYAKRPKSRQKNSDNTIIKTESKTDLEFEIKFETDLLDNQRRLRRSGSRQTSEASDLDFKNNIKEEFEQTANILDINSPQRRQKIKLKRENSLSIESLNNFEMDTTTTSVIKDKKSKKSSRKALNIDSSANNNEENLSEEKINKKKSKKSRSKNRANDHALPIDDNQTDQQSIDSKYESNAFTESLNSEKKVKRTKSKEKSKLNVDDFVIKDEDKVINQEKQQTDIETNFKSNDETPIDFDLDLHKKYVKHEKKSKKHSESRTTSKIKKTKSRKSSQNGNEENIETSTTINEINNQILEKNPLKRRHSINELQENINNIEIITKQNIYMTEQNYSFPCNKIEQKNEFFVSNLNYDSLFISKNKLSENNETTNISSNAETKTHRSLLLRNYIEKNPSLIYSNLDPVVCIEINQDVENLIKLQNMDNEDLLTENDSYEENVSQDDLDYQNIYQELSNDDFIENINEPQNIINTPSNNCATPELRECVIVLERIDLKKCFNPKVTFPDNLNAEKNSSSTHLPCRIKLTDIDQETVNISKSVINIHKTNKTKINPEQPEKQTISYTNIFGKEFNKDDETNIKNSDKKTDLETVKSETKYNNKNRKIHIKQTNIKTNELSMAKIKQIEIKKYAETTEKDLDSTDQNKKHVTSSYIKEQVIKKSITENTLNNIISDLSIFNIDNKSSKIEPEKSLDIKKPSCSHESKIKINRSHQRTSDKVSVNQSIKPTEEKNKDSGNLNTGLKHNEKLIYLKPIIHKYNTEVKLHTHNHSNKKTSAEITQSKSDSERKLKLSKPATKTLDSLEKSVEVPSHSKKLHIVHENVSNKTNVESKKSNKERTSDEKPNLDIKIQVQCSKQTDKTSENDLRTILNEKHKSSEKSTETHLNKSEQSDTKKLEIKKPQKIILNKCLDESSTSKLHKSSETINKPKSDARKIKLNKHFSEDSHSNIIKTDQLSNVITNIKLSRNNETSNICSEKDATDNVIKKSPEIKIEILGQQMIRPNLEFIDKSDLYDIVSEKLEKIYNENQKKGLLESSEKIADKKFIEPLKITLKTNTAERIIETPKFEEPRRSSINFDSPNELNEIYEVQNEDNEILEEEYINDEPLNIIPEKVFISQKIEPKHSTKQENNTIHPIKEIQNSIKINPITKNIQITVPTTETQATSSKIETKQRNICQEKNRHENSIEIPQSASKNLLPKQNVNHPIDSKLTQKEEKSEFISPNEVLNLKELAQKSVISTSSINKNKPKHTFKFIEKCAVKRPPSRQPRKIMLNRPKLDSPNEKSLQQTKTEFKISKTDTVKISEDDDVISILADTSGMESVCDASSVKNDDSDNEYDDMEDTILNPFIEPERRAEIENWLHKQEKSPILDKSSSLEDKEDKPSVSIFKSPEIPIARVIPANQNLEIEISHNSSNTTDNSGNKSTPEQVETCSEVVNKLIDKPVKYNEYPFTIIKKMCYNIMRNESCSRRYCKYFHKLPKNWENDFKKSSKESIIKFYNYVKERKLSNLFRQTFHIVAEQLGIYKDYNNLTNLVKDVLEINVYTDREPLIQNIITALCKTGFTFNSTVEIVFRSANVEKGLKDLLCDILLNLAVERKKLEDNWSIIQMLSNHKNYDIDKGIVQFIILETLNKDTFQKEIAIKVYNDLIKNLPAYNLRHIVVPMLQNFIEMLRKHNLYSEADDLYNRCVSLNILKEFKKNEETPTKNISKVSPMQKIDSNNLTSSSSNCSLTSLNADMFKYPVAPNRTTSQNNNQYKTQNRSNYFNPKNNSWTPSQNCPVIQNTFSQRMSPEKNETGRMNKFSNVVVQSFPQNYDLMQNIIEKTYIISPNQLHSQTTADNFCITSTKYDNISPGSVNLNFDTTKSYLPDQSFLNNSTENLNLLPQTAIDNVPAKVINSIPSIKPIIEHRDEIPSLLNKYDYSPKASYFLPSKLDKLLNNSKTLLEEIQDAIISENISEISSLFMKHREGHLTDVFLKTVMDCLIETSHNYPTLYSNLCEILVVKNDTALNYVLKTIGVNLIIHLCRNLNYDQAYLVNKVLTSKFHDDVYNCKLYMKENYTYFKRILIISYMYINKDDFLPAWNLLKDNALDCGNYWHGNHDQAELKYRNFILGELFKSLVKVKNWSIGLQVLQYMIKNNCKEIDVKLYSDEILVNAINNNCHLDAIKEIINHNPYWFKFFRKSTFRAILIKSINSNYKLARSLYSIGCQLKIYPELIGNERVIQLSTYFTFEEVRLILDSFFQNMLNYMPVHHSLTIQILTNDNIKQLANDELPKIMHQFNLTPQIMATRILNILHNTIKPPISKTTTNYDNTIQIDQQQLNEHLNERLLMKY